MAYSLQVADSYFKDSPVNVAVTGESDKDWVGLFLETDSEELIASGELSSIYWNYITASPNGIIDISSTEVMCTNVITGKYRSDYMNYRNGLPLTRYKVILFSNDSYNIVAKASFELKVPFTWMIDSGKIDDKVFTAGDMGGENFVWDYLPSIKTSWMINLCGWLSNPYGIGTYTSKYTPDRGYIYVTSDTYYYSLNSGAWQAIADVEVQERADLVSSGIAYAGDSSLNGVPVYKTAGFANLTIRADVIPNEDCTIQIALKTKNGHYIPFLVFSNVYGAAYRITYECGSQYSGVVPETATGVRKISEEHLPQLVQEGYDGGAWYYDWYRTIPVRVGDEVTQNLEIHWGWDKHVLSKVLLDRDIIDDIYEASQNTQVPSAEAVKKAVESHKLDFNESIPFNKGYIDNRPFYETNVIGSVTKITPSLVRVENLNNGRKFISGMMYGGLMYVQAIATIHAGSVLVINVNNKVEYAYPDYQDQGRLKTPVYYKLPNLSYEYTLYKGDTIDVYVSTTRVGDRHNMYFPVVVASDNNLSEIEWVLLSDTNVTVKQVDEKFLPVTQSDYNNKVKTSKGYINNKPFYEEDFTHRVASFQKDVFTSSVSNYSAEFNGVSKVLNGYKFSSQFYFLPYGLYELEINGVFYPLDFQDTSILEKGFSVTLPNHVTVYIYFDRGNGCFGVESGVSAVSDLPDAFTLYAKNTIFIGQIYQSESDVFGKWTHSWTSAIFDYNDLNFEACDKVIIRSPANNINIAGIGKKANTFKIRTKKKDYIECDPLDAGVPIRIEKYSLQASINKLGLDRPLEVACVVNNPYTLKKLDEKFLPEKVPSHIENQDIHVTVAEKERWNALAGTIDIPSKLSELENDAGFVTKLVSDLENYYSKEVIDQKVSAIPKFSIEVVSSLPVENISATTVYLLPSGEASPNVYTEYIYANGAWEKLGVQTVDLTNYVTKEETGEIINEALSQAKASGEFNGYTPVKGIDYWTSQDVAEMQAYIDNAILGGEW